MDASLDKTKLVNDAITLVVKSFNLYADDIVKISNDKYNYTINDKEGNQKLRISFPEILDELHDKLIVEPVDVSENSKLTQLILIVLTKISNLNNIPYILDNIKMEIRNFQYTSENNKDTERYHSKYLKYKNKYLKLKNSIRLDYI